MWGWLSTAGSVVRGEGQQAGLRAWKQREHLSRDRYNAIYLAVNPSVIASGEVTVDSACSKGNASTLACATEMSNCTCSGLSPVKDQSEHQK